MMIADESRNVATGRLMNGAEKWIPPTSATSPCSKLFSSSGFIPSVGASCPGCRYFESTAPLHNDQLVFNLPPHAPASPAHAAETLHPLPWCPDTCARCDRRTGKRPASYTA